MTKNSYIYVCVQYRPELLTSHVQIFQGVFYKDQIKINQGFPKDKCNVVPYTDISGLLAINIMILYCGQITHEENFHSSTNMHDQDAIKG